jgi:hypothetical protein
MPTFITIGYGDRAGYEQTSAAARAAAHAHDGRLRERGVRMGMAGEPIQVRNPEGRATATTPGPFLSAALPVAGFAIIEADSLDDAVEAVASTPCAVAHGVVEVWPLEQPRST